MNDAHWELEIAINVSAVVQGSLFGIKYMGKNNGGKGGVIVNIASILGLQNLAGCPVYVGTKHFVVGLDRSFGTPYFLERTGITFLTMCPGVTDTPLDIGGWKVRLSGPSNVAKGMYTLITKGENGSVWVSEGGQPIYEVAIPDRTTLRK
ncbi:hypothetical protein NQ318_003917 [Aromia moschata]|uniref:Alcohol dehydrogenase n=1 Tax=Aromia moschata TaxID=1265417 RepID=A0AAV8ZAL0_9CUCU|nr:hypothetical protein NQ318_003917 [Aromia moschata]